MAFRDGTPPSHSARVEGWCGNSRQCVFSGEHRRNRNCRANFRQFAGCTCRRSCAALYDTPRPVLQIVKAPETVL
jgi:hypothetical protein